MVVVVPGRLFCITTWLPLLRTSTKPCFAKMAHTSRPDRTRSLPNGYLDLCHKQIAMQPLLDLVVRGRLEKQLQGFFEILPRLLHRITLTGNIKFGAERHVSVTFPFNNSRKFLGH